MDMFSKSPRKFRGGQGGTAQSIIENSGSGMHGMIQAPKPGIDAFRGNYKGGKSPKSNPEPTTKVR